MTTNEGEPTFYYRYEDKVYVGCAVTEWGVEDYYRVGPHLELLVFRLVKKTPKGAWIQRWYEHLSPAVQGEQRWVSDEATKRYALPTKELALRSFVARKQRQVQIYEARLRDAKRALTLGDEALRAERETNQQKGAG